METRIPVINLDASGAAQSLLRAAGQFGFVYITHDALDLRPEEVDSMFGISRELFSSAPQIKSECTINSAASGKNKGWLPMHAETLDPSSAKNGDVKEAFNIGEYKHGKPQQPLPSTVARHEKEIGDFFGKCHNLCNRLLRMLAIAFEIPDDHGGSEWFASRHDRTKESGSVLRLLYYPALPDSMLQSVDEDLRAGAHSDYGSITLLFRLPNQPGLEVLTPEGQWATVPVEPEPTPTSGRLPILVNIGDLLSFWTNGLLRSTIHRVVFPKESDGPGGRDDRYSIAYFCHPQDDARLIEIPSQVVKDHSGDHGLALKTNSTVLTARDHLNSRLAATYGRPRAQAAEVQV